MSSFLGGPANGRELNLRRAPIYLRVVVDRETGAVDALDQLDDEPTAGEDVHVYELAAPPQVAFVCGRPRGASGRFEWGLYRSAPEQPPDDVARDTSAWRAWAAGQCERANP